MTDPALWDFAGPDGLALARALFGPEASALSVYQSLETQWGGAACSLLRLCENNFRVSGAADGFAEAFKSAAIGKRIWIKPSRLASLFLGEDALASLPPVCSPKPPHRLAGLPPGRAVPASVGACAVLVWRHSVGGVPAVEIQTAPRDLSVLRDLLPATLSCQ